MIYYSKLIVAVVGLLVLICTRYGLDLERHQQAVIDVMLAIATAAGVWLAKNRPTTSAQVQEAQKVVNEGSKKMVIRSKTDE